MDPEVPPEVDDGSNEDMKTGKIDDKEKVENIVTKIYLINFRKMMFTIWNRNSIVMELNRNGCRFK
jgi:hypothetical protein